MAAQTGDTPAATLEPGRCWRSHRRLRRLLDYHRQTETQQFHYIHSQHRHQYLYPFGSRKTTGSQNQIFALDQHPPHQHHCDRLQWPIDCHQRTMKQSFHCNHLLPRHRYQPQAAPRKRRRTRTHEHDQNQCHHHHYQMLQSPL